MNNFKLKSPKIIEKKKLEKFFRDNGLSDLILLSKNNEKKVNEMKIKNPYKPELIDLYNLYNFIILNKRITVLEFGSGWSSLIIVLALHKLKQQFEKKVTNLRRNNPFELFIVENEKKFLNITKKRMRAFKKKFKINVKVNYTFSEVQMIKFNNRIASEYKKLPLCNPDFVYIDGPDQFNIKKKVNGITIAHKDMMPMICDPIKFEYFYTPGTIILTDGRAANANFLKLNFRRRWKYINNKKTDQHIFYLNDASLGKYNSRQLNFYNN